MKPHQNKTQTSTSLFCQIIQPIVLLPNPDWSLEVHPANSYIISFSLAINCVLPFETKPRYKLWHSMLLGSQAAQGVSRERGSSQPFLIFQDYSQGLLRTFIPSMAEAWYDSVTITAFMWTATQSYHHFRNFKLQYSK